VSYHNTTRCRNPKDLDSRHRRTAEKELPEELIGHR